VWESRAAVGCGRGKLRWPTSAGHQQPTGPPPAGQVIPLGVQLTDVVETANASSSTHKTFFPLVISCRAYARRGFLLAVSAETGEILQRQNRRVRPMSARRSRGQHSVDTVI
jgi:hypothetical protein